MSGESQRVHLLGKGENIRFYAKNIDIYAYIHWNRAKKRVPKGVHFETPLREKGLNWHDYRRGWPCVIL